MTPRRATTRREVIRSLISDALRTALGVPPMADQEERRLNVQKNMDELNKAHAAAAKK